MTHRLSSFSTTHTHSASLDLHTGLWGRRRDQERQERQLWKTGAGGQDGRVPDYPTSPIKAQACEPNQISCYKICLFSEPQILDLQEKKP